MSMPKITEGDLLDAYRQTELEAMGVRFETALQIPGLRATLEGAIRAQHMWTQAANLRGSQHLERMQPRERGQ